MQQVLMQFGDVELFLNTHSIIAPTLNPKLLVFLCTKERVPTARASCCS
jgi:hypothetical protein